ncbi:MAG: hypothetical protein ITG02_05920 [Patulibacter sp.]|nr:hypothetical protein [Patulibacter sp.]
MRQRLIPLLAVAMASTALTGCGEKHSVVTHAPNELVYVHLGPEDGPWVNYQVQVSRQLNPGDFRNPAARGNREKVDPEDSSYVAGLTGPAVELKTDPENPINNEVFFGVFIAAYNENKQPMQSASIEDFEIRDSAYIEGEAGSEAHVFRPVTGVDPANPPNPFLYRQATIPAASSSSTGVQPLPNSPAANGTTQGELLLFKIPQINLENRPLTLHIKEPSGGHVTIDLDV